MLNLHAYELFYLHRQIKIFIERFNKSKKRVNNDNDDCTANEHLERYNRK